MPEDRIDALTEAADAEFMYQYEATAAPPTKTALGIATTRIGGGVALSMRNDITGYWSKALGFGFTELVASELIGQVVEFYRGEDIYVRSPHGTATRSSQPRTCSSVAKSALIVARAAEATQRRLPLASRGNR
jgi:hypothetical protein